MALELSHKQEHRDHILGLRTRTHTGRPDWDKVRILMYVRPYSKITMAAST